MEFTSPAHHYESFMGRYTRTLAPALADAAGIVEDMRVLDVGCGPGGLTVELADRVGAERVAAIDPAEQFATFARTRAPGADVRVGIAEELPWADGEFDATLSCLVIAFMSDPEAGVREMVRVTRPGGTVAACMWDIPGGGMTMLRTFWSAVKTVQPDAAGETLRAGVSEGDLGERFERAGLRDVTAGALQVSADYSSFDDFWTPFTFAVGPAGGHLASMSPEEQVAVREACREQLSDGPFSLSARAWYARGSVAG